jgi:hypothetical protein
MQVYAGTRIVTGAHRHEHLISINYYKLGKCGSHKLIGVQRIPPKHPYFQAPLCSRLVTYFCGPQLLRKNYICKMQTGIVTGLLTVLLPYVLQQQIQIITWEIWRSGKMIQFVAGIRMPSRTSRIWPLEIYHLVSLFPVVHSMQNIELAAAKQVTISTFSAIPHRKQH